MVGFLDAILGLGPSNVRSTRQAQAQSNLAAANAIGAAAQGVAGDPLAAQRQARNIFVNEQARADAAQQRFAFQEDQAKRQRIARAFGTALSTAGDVGAFLSSQSDSSPTIAPGGDSVAVTNPTAQTASNLTAPQPGNTSAPRSELLVGRTDAPGQFSDINGATALGAGGSSPVSTPNPVVQRTDNPGAFLDSSQGPINNPSGLPTFQPPSVQSSSSPAVTTPGALGANLAQDTAAVSTAATPRPVPTNQAQDVPTNSQEPLASNQFLNAALGQLGSGEFQNLTGNRGIDASLGIADNLISKIFG